MTLIRSAISWILALALIFVFLQATIHPLPNPPAGQVKLFDLPGENIVFQTIVDQSRYPIVEPTGRVLVAVAEIFAALMLLFPMTRRFGAFLAIAILGGAVAFHLSPWLGREVPLALGSSETDGGSLFYLAIAMLVASVLLFFIHPSRD